MGLYSIVSYCIGIYKSIPLSPPLLPQYHLIYKTLSWDKTNVKVWKQSRIKKKSLKRQFEKIPQKLYNLYLKTFFWLTGFFEVCKNEFARFFISLALSRLSGWFAKNTEILKNVWKVRLKRYPKYPCFNIGTSWTDWISLLILKYPSFFFIDLAAFK